MSVGLFPGEFDVFNDGHRIAIEDAARGVRTLYVAVGDNPEKPTTIFSRSRRIDHVRKGTAHIPNVKVIRLNGLAANLARAVGASVIFRSIREVTDFNFEGKYANMNFAKGLIPTIWIPASQESNYIDSKLLDQFAKEGADLSEFMPANVAKALLRRHGRKTRHLELVQRKFKRIDTPSKEDVTTAFYGGSFDPFHNGHLAVVETAAAVFDRVIISCGINPMKKPTFEVELKMKMIRDAVKHLPNVEVSFFEGLIIDAAREQGANVIVKGIRGVDDFVGEQTQADFNDIYGKIKTVYVPAQSRHFSLSSSMIKFLASQGLDIRPFVPKSVVKPLKKAVRGFTPEDIQRFEEELKNKPFSNKPTIRKGKIDVAKYRVINNYDPEVWVEAYASFMVDMVLKTKNPAIKEACKGLGREIANAYQEPFRKHHDITHLIDGWNNVIKNCVYGNIDPVVPLLTYPVHDVICVPGSPSNELESKMWASERYRALGVKKRLINRVGKITMDTKEHKFDLRDAQSCAVLDEDSGVLQAPWERYKEYAYGIYFEYAGRADAPYAPKDYFKGREAFLLGMLKHKKLYSGLFPAYSTARAKDNIQKEINLLRALQLSEELSDNGGEVIDVAKWFGIENIFERGLGLDPIAA